MCSNVDRTWMNTRHNARIGWCARATMKNGDKEMTYAYARRALIQVSAIVLGRRSYEKNKNIMNGGKRAIFFQIHRVYFRNGVFFHIPPSVIAGCSVADNMLISHSYNVCICVYHVVVTATYI